MLHLPYICLVIICNAGNMSGDCVRDIKKQYLSLSCSSYLPVDSTQIPTGEITSVEGSLFDLRQLQDNFKNENDYNKYGILLGERIPFIDGAGEDGYDHCFVIDKELDNNDNEDRRFDLKLRPVATLTDLASGRMLICESSQPGVQVGNNNVYYILYMWVHVCVFVKASVFVCVCGAKLPENPFKNSFKIC